MLIDENAGFPCGFGDASSAHILACNVEQAETTV